MSDTSCILFHFYIKPQHLHSRFDLVNRCILFHFYIKPQLIIEKPKIEKCSNLFK